MQSAPVWRSRRIEGSADLGRMSIHPRRGQERPTAHKQGNVSFAPARRQRRGEIDSAAYGRSRYGMEGTRAMQKFRAGHPGWTHGAAPYTMTSQFLTRCRSRSIRRRRTLNMLDMKCPFGGGLSFPEEPRSANIEKYAVHRWPSSRSCGVRRDAGGPCERTGRLW